MARKLVKTVQDRIDAEQGREGRLVLRQILASGLAEGGGIALDVEQVVADLEGQAERVGVTVQRRARIGIGIAGDRAQAHRAAQQGAGLHRMQAFEVGERKRKGVRVIFRSKDINSLNLPTENMTLTPFRASGRSDVQCLSATHARHAGRACEFGQHRHLPRIALRRGGKHFEGQRLQCIAGKDRGGFVEGHVHGRLASAQGVVVHRRQVVVYQRVAMDQFDRDGGRIQRGLVGTKGTATGVHKQWPHALAAIEHAMPHRRVQPLRGGLR